MHRKSSSDRLFLLNSPTIAGAVPSKQGCVDCQAATRTHAGIRPKAERLIRQHVVTFPGRLRPVLEPRSIFNPISHIPRHPDYGFRAGPAAARIGAGSGPHRAINPVFQLSQQVR